MQTHRRKQRTKSKNRDDWKKKTVSVIYTHEGVTGNNDDDDDAYNLNLGWSKCRNNVLC